MSLTKKQREAKHALDEIIRKSRVHLYKPIQLAEILYRDRIIGDIDLNRLETYRTQSKKWRDDISLRLVGRISTSSAKFQDNLFENNAMPPSLLSELGCVNRANNGLVEAYIYSKFEGRQSQLSESLKYCLNTDPANFYLEQFLSSFRDEPGLRRSIDKIYEIVVFSLFTSLVEALSITLRVSLDSTNQGILEEFEDFTRRIIRLDSRVSNVQMPARLFRVGVTNAADRGLDMWANFGLAIQVKHLALTEEGAERIVGDITADRIVIVCKDAEKQLIVSVLTQIGWKSRIQAIVTEQDLIVWYEKAMRGKYKKILSRSVLNTLAEQIELEFPSSESSTLDHFRNERKYYSLEYHDWQ